MEAIGIILRPFGVDLGIHGGMPTDATGNGGAGCIREGDPKYRKWFKEDDLKAHGGHWDHLEAIL